MHMLMWQLLHVKGTYIIDTYVLHWCITSRKHIAGVSIWCVLGTACIYVCVDLITKLVQGNTNTGNTRKYIWNHKNKYTRTIIKWDIVLQSTCNLKKHYKNEDLLLLFGVLLISMLQLLLQPIASDCFSRNVQQDNCQWWTVPASYYYLQIY